MAPRGGRKVNLAVNHKGMFKLPGEGLLRFDSAPPETARDGDDAVME